MKKRPGIKLLLLLLLMILILSGGCYTKYSLAKTELFQAGGLNCIMLQTKDSVWTVVNYVVSDDLFKGMKASPDFKPKLKQTAYLYAAPPDAVIVEDNMVSVPLTNIAKAEYNRINQVRTFESLTLGVLAAIPVIFFLILLIGGGYDM